MSERSSSPTIADVAREAGVSISTVSRFLNDSSQLSDGTTNRVREAIRQLGYLPRSAARSLALRRTNTLGVLMEAVGTPFFAAVVAGAEEAAYEEGFSMLIATRTNMRNGGPPPLGPFNTDGLLLVAVPWLDAMTAYFQPGYPVVSLYQPAPKSTEIPLVTVQNKRGAFLVVEHLIRVHGMTRIGFLRGPEWNRDSALREQGYRQALRKYGIPVDEELIGVGNFSMTMARHSIHHWHKNRCMPQAIFTGNDESALDVILALYELGLHVPEEVAVVGFDDSSIAANLVPPLTTVRAPIREVGREGVRKIIELIRKGSTESITLLSTDLVIRQSCGCSCPEESALQTSEAALQTTEAALQTPEAAFPLNSVENQPSQTGSSTIFHCVDENSASGLASVHQPLRLGDEMKGGG